MSQLIKVVNNYKVEFFFYLFEGPQEMLGLNENSRTSGYIDQRTAQIVLLNSDSSKPYEQKGILKHEIGHGIYSKDNETERRRKDSIGDYGIAFLEYLI